MLLFSYSYILPVPKDRHGKYSELFFFFTYKCTFGLTCFLFGNCAVSFGIWTMDKLTENCKDLNFKSSCISSEVWWFRHQKGYAKAHYAVTELLLGVLPCGKGLLSNHLAPLWLLNKYVRQGPVAPVWAKVWSKIGKTGFFLSLLAASRTSYVRKLILIYFFLKG